MHLTTPISLLAPEIARSCGVIRHPLNIAYTLDMAAEENANLVTPDQREETPPAFYDNLSRIWVTPRSLRELQRRLPKTSYTVPPDRSALRGEDIAGLRKFAMRGGPEMGDIRGVSPKGGAKRLVDDE